MKNKKWANLVIIVFTTVFLQADPHKKVSFGSFIQEKLFLTNDFEKNSNKTLERTFEINRLKRDGEWIEFQKSLNEFKCGSLMLDKKSDEQLIHLDYVAGKEIANYYTELSRYGFILKNRYFNSSDAPYGFKKSFLNLSSENKKVIKNKIFNLAALHSMQSAIEKQLKLRDTF